MSDMALPSSYLDFNALAKLKGEAAHDPTQAAKKTAEQFESYFLQQMMKAMRETIDRSDLVEGKNMDTYQDMMDKEVSLQMVKRGGMGLADMLEKQMLKQHELSTQDALKLHPTGAQEFVPLNRKAEPMPVGKPQAIGAYELKRDAGGRP